jgi:methylmalonyl-CoA mutase
VIRSTEEEREQQIRTARTLTGRSRGEREKRLRAVQTAAIHNRNIFEQLMEACKISTIGQVTTALFEVGGQYRRSM